LILKGLIMKNITLAFLSLIIALSLGCTKKSNKGPLVINMNHGKDIIPLNTPGKYQMNVIG
jgi:hypothetical protein